MSRLSTTYRVNRRQEDAIVMPARTIGENLDRLGHRYIIDGSRLYGVDAPPMNGARECARRLRQMGRVGVLLGPVVLDIDGESRVTRAAEPRRLAAEPDTPTNAVAKVGSADSPSPGRKPLTQEQRDKKNERDRARRAAAKKENVA